MTPKQKAFCQEYLKDLNATQAAIRAGYSEKTAQRIGSENLSKPLIADYLQKRMKKTAEKVEITVEQVLKQILDDRQAALDRGNLSVAMKANELLGKHMAMFTEKTQISGTDEGPIKVEVLTDDELRRIAAKGR